jgi:3-dehydroquinate dehydratase-2
MKPAILIINGPGLDDPGDCDGSSDESLTLPAIRRACEELSDELGVQLDFRQTNDQDRLFEWIAGESEAFDGVIINPIAGSSSATLNIDGYRSAIQALAKHGKTIVEVRIGNIYKQSAESTESLHEPEADMGFICGFGINGYLLALRAMSVRLMNNGQNAA